MRAARIGRLLLAFGLLVGAAAGVGLLVGFEPARLPPALLNIAAYKLTFLAALGLLAAGATFLRYARRKETQAPARPMGTVTEGQSPASGLRASRDREPVPSSRSERTDGG